MKRSKFVAILVVLALVLMVSAQALPVSAHTGCVRTPGYWKNHLGAWPAWISPNTFIPRVSLTYLQALNYGGSHMSSKLAKFWVATQLSFQQATAPQFVVDVFNLAQLYLFFGAPDPGASTLESWKNVLDNYNNGIGADVPPECS
jgi:hypothetical protein